MTPPVIGGEGHAAIAGTPDTPFGQLQTSIGPSFPILDPQRPANVVAETFPRWVGPKTGQATALAAGTLWLDAITLPVGTYSTITWHSAGAGAAMTNQWFSLWDPFSNAAGPALLGSTVDDLATAWGANTAKSLSLATGTGVVRITRAGMYYVGCVVAGTTPPVLLGFADTSSVVIGRAPILSGQSNGGLTTPLTTIGATAGAPGLNGARTYASVG